MSDNRALAKHYGGARVLVLGATGFIGRWVARRLGELGAELHLATRDRQRLSEVASRYGFDGREWVVDLDAFEGVDELLAKTRPTITFNLAGYGVRPGERDETRSQRINGEAVRHLCRAVGRYAPQEGDGVQFVHVGSALEYGALSGELTETVAPRPTTPYGRSKLAGTVAVESAVADGTLRAVVARLFTIYGPGETDGRLLPSLLAAASGDGPVELTSGLQVRDFVYVEDVAEALVRLGAARAGPETIVHVASGRLTRVRDFVAVAARVLDLPAERLQFGALKTPWYETDPSAVSCERLRDRVGWTPESTIAEGVGRTASFVGLPVREEAGAEDHAPKAEIGEAPDLTLVLVCSTEGARVRTLATDLAHAFDAEKIALEILLVDRGADGKTRKALEETLRDRLPARPVELAEDRGYGHAVRHGLSEARGRYVGYLCADGHVDAAAALKTYHLVAESRSPRLVKVRRRFRMDGALRKLVSIVYNASAICLFGRLGTLDLNGSPKIFPREWLDRLELTSDGWFLDSEVVLKARRAGLPILELNVVAQMSQEVMAPISTATCWELLVNLFAYRLGVGSVARRKR